MDGTNQLRKKYLPNLTEHLACCTAIYQRMIHMLPPTYTEGEDFSWPVAQFAQLEASIDEQHKYTDLITVRFKWLVNSDWLTNLDVRLKLCHDMNIAEVVGFIVNERMINLQNRDDTNQEISYPNEKKQIHHLLFEWLSLSLTS